MATLNYRLVSEQNQIVLLAMRRDIESEVVCTIYCKLCIEKVA